MHVGSRQHLMVKETLRYVGRLVIEVTDAGADMGYRRLS